MTLPRPVRRALEEEIGRIETVEPVGGGCVSAASRIEASGGTYFVKYERDPPAGFFSAEAAGLAELRGATSLIRIPEVVGQGDLPEGWSWLVLEWLQPGPAPADSWARLGAGLAELHHCRVSWGWTRNGFIGRLPQSNAPAATWAEFWIERRIQPQLHLSSGSVGTSAEWRRLEERLPSMLEVAERDGPSLLHGDLWSGNVLQTRYGPALVDPAAYHGHREVDLAMSRLFGGFDRAFFDAYAAEWPLEPGAELRCDAYQLYYLLVHVNLFGEAYTGRTVQTLRRLLAELG